MKNPLTLFPLMALATLRLAAGESASPDGAWSPMLDEKLSQFETYVGVPDPSVAVPGYTHEADPKQDKPLGMNQDPLHIFTVRMVDGEPILHITGEIFGVLASKKSYDDFHLRVQFRWGSKKHAPRADKPRDSGLLYRVFGPPKVWSLCLECQVMEDDIGSLYALGGKAKVASVVIPNPVAKGAKGTKGQYTPGAPFRLYQGCCVHGTDYQEMPTGEWNTVEVIAIGDRSIHLLNGRVVNVLQDSTCTVDGKTSPLVTGPIQIQSEGAEVEYRKVEIRPLASFPPQYQSLFSEVPATPPTPAPAP